MRAERPSPTALGGWLAVALVGAKAVHWGWPWGGESGLAVWARDLAVSAHADVAFAAGFAVAAFLLLRAARPWPRAERAAGVLLVALGAFCALFAVASVQIFAFLRSPLTYALLYLAGDMRSMSSSIGSFVTPAVAVAVVGVPAAYVIAVRRSSRRASRSVPGRRPRAVAAGLLALSAGWAAWGAEVAEGRWADRADVLIAQSPHWEFLASVATEVKGGAEPLLADTFPPEALDDFVPAARRRPASPFEGGPRPRNVLVVVLESTGARYLGLYGSPYATTPRLEAEAAHAAVFDDVYAHVGLTANSLAAMSLSTYPYMTWREYTQEYPGFPGRTAADVLRPRGYRTAFLTSGFLDYVGMGRFLANRGFEEVRDWKGLGGGAAANSWGGSDGVLVDRTLEWIDRDRGRPFYGVLWTQESHHPYDPPAGATPVDFFAGRPRPADDYDLGRYLNTVADVDRQLGRLFDGLRARGLDRDTAVVVTGDHGETFGDPHPTWGHGFRLYEESVHVPFLVWSPLLFAHGERRPTVGGHVDLSPTVLDLLGFAAPSEWEGRSLFAPDRPPRAYFYAANDRYLLGVREGTLKYVYDATRGREELFDLASDPEERVNVAASHPDTCRSLRARLAAWKHHAAARLAEARAATVADAGWPLAGAAVR